MIGRIKSVWQWLVEGLAEAASWALDCAKRRPTYRIVIGEGAAAIQAPDGTETGQVQKGETGERFVLPSIADRLAGSRIELSIPVSWMFRHKLDAVALESVPFLDAFVRHQIERITPWRAADVYYRVLKSFLPGTPTRVAIEIVVVPKRLVGSWVVAFERLHPTLLTIRPQGVVDGRDLAIILDQGRSPRLERLRRSIGIALLGLSLAYLGSMTWLWWLTIQVREDVQSLDRLIDERKTVLARAQHRDQSGLALDAKLRELRKTQARAVDVIEALAQALPDSAHLTDFDLEKDHLTLSGISIDTALLVPALETSGHFADVAFGAATTKVESGAGDRFHLEMRVLGRTAPLP